jgi:cellulose synthase/poly-beta-1,6-N-acetylglucosamine synthase-like glycosyltransferase
MSPLVTVYLPTRNRVALLHQAAESVLTQTFADFELLIVDDGSDDATPELLEALAQRDPRVRIFRHDRPCGPQRARNLALQHARGRFLTGLDDDDLMLPQRLESLLDAEPETYALVCSSFWLDKGGRRSRMNRFGRAITLDKLLHYNIVGNQALMVTERVREIGGFDETMLASQDYDLWLRLVDRFGSGRRIANPTYVVRTGLITETITRSPRFAQGAKQLTAKHASLMSPKHLRSQRLVHRITANAPLTLKDFGATFSRGAALLWLKYWVSRTLFYRCLNKFMKNSMRLRKQA